MAPVVLILCTRRMRCGGEVNRIAFLLPHIPASARPHSPSYHQHPQRNANTQHGPNNDHPGGESLSLGTVHRMTVLVSPRRGRRSMKRG